MQLDHFRITPAFILSIATALVTQVIALVPSWAPYKSAAIQILGIVIPAAFLVANAIHAHAKATAEMAQNALQVVPAPQQPPAPPAA